MSASGTGAGKKINAMARPFTYPLQSLTPIEAFDRGSKCNEKTYAALHICLLSLWEIRFIFCDYTRNATDNPTRLISNK